MISSCRTFGLSFILSLALFAPACKSKVAQCNEFIDAINKHQAELTTASAKLDVPDQAQLAGAVDGLNKVLDNLDGDLSKLNFSDEAIQGYQKRYREMITKMRENTTALQAAGKASDVEKLNQISDKLNAISDEEDKLVDEINGYCQGTK